MNKIDELIAQYCPDGVEWKELGEVCEFRNGFAFKSNKFKATGNPILRIGNIQNRKVDTSNLIYFDITEYSENLKPFEVVNGDVLVAMSGATTGKIGRLNSNEIFYLNQRVGKFEPNKKLLVNDFLYHFLLTKTDELYVLAGGGAQPNLSSTSLMKKITIPIPPLPVQEEIVSILDKFTALEAELEAELEARTRQYEYYRNELLSFEGKDVEWKTLGEVFNLKNGYTPSTKNKEYWADGSIPWFRMEDIRENGRILSNSIQKVNVIAVKSGKLFPSNSILIATSATIGEHALVTIPHLSNQRFTSLSLKDAYLDKINMKYIFYYCFILDEWCKKNITTSSFASVDMVGFRKFKIPVPPIEEQERIVAILDKFDALVNDISTGLPAEIQARRQQYEYYRGKLLTFEPLTA